jgi:hypothetical protein
MKALKEIVLRALKNLKYASTLNGLTLLSGLVGYAVSPELLDAIATAVVAVLGVINLFMSDADAAAAEGKAKK